ncbi:MAG: cation diffusion facilitator family transporter [Candidatus Odinarchaeum yellowstonii]|uniref:Cation diffusion facilitator family transporter n=1 Tax=Odinarchaeota yellowstonii (strain LCB_4) TaxID=1841599 RepID=A0AAF0D2V5_ODILC|nr:MAG: cation diffusion facilitator family transporter [Candidatus Odinarchaeum yellowstonii]
MSENYNKIRLTLIYTLILNLLVVIGKLTVGLISNSLSMISDSLHSLLDASSNIIGLIGIRIAKRKPDEGHPYGHSKYTSLAALLIAVLLVITAFEVFQGAITRFMTPVAPEITVINWIVMSATIGLNVFISRFERHQGLKYNSNILIADSMHTNTDIYLSLSVIASFILIYLGYPLFDPVFSIVIGIVIFYTGFSIIKKISSELTDSLVIDSRLIKEIVANIKGVKDVHKIRSRGSTAECFVDLHITVDRSLSVEAGHDISIQVEDYLKKAFPFIKDVTVHIEPYVKNVSKRDEFDVK